MGCGVHGFHGERPTRPEGKAKAPWPWSQHGGRERSHDVQVQPYLFFDGRCEEAIEFYRQALRAEVTALIRFKDSPDSGISPRNPPDKVMHASLRVGETTVLASDGRCEGRPVFQGFALSLTVADAAEAERLFASLGDGGHVL